MNPSLVNAPKKWGKKIQWINYCWEGTIKNEEVCGNKENKEKDNEKDNPKYKSENANNVENDLKFNNDEQQEAIKQFKEYSDIDDIEPPPPTPIER